jgi:hypothetical protein
VSVAVLIIYGLVCAGVGGVDIPPSLVNTSHSDLAGRSSTHFVNSLLVCEMDHYIPVPLILAGNLVVDTVRTPSSPYNQAAKQYIT